MEICRKITVAGINNVRGGFDVKPETPPYLVARVMGLARAVANKETTYGASLKFTGEFRAINADGEEFAAPVIYLPAPADEMLATAISGAGENGVQFAFDIFIEATPKKTPVDRGYTFRVKPLLDTKPSDPLAVLQASLPPAPVKVKQAALPFESESDAPKADPVQETDSKEVKKALKAK